MGWTINEMFLHWSDQKEIKRYYKRWRAPRVFVLCLKFPLRKFNYVALTFLKDYKKTTQCLPYTVIFIFPLFFFYFILYIFTILLKHSYFETASCSRKRFIQHNLATSLGFISSSVSFICGESELDAYTATQWMPLFLSIYLFILI